MNKAAYASHATGWDVHCPYQKYKNVVVSTFRLIFVGGTSIDKTEWQ